VFAGMLGVTLFGLILTPVFYWTIRKLTGGKLQHADPHDDLAPIPVAPTPHLGAAE